MKSILDSMSTLYTEGVPLNMIKKTGETDAKIIIPSAFLKIEPAYKDEITVKYEVKKRK